MICDHVHDTFEPEQVLKSRILCKMLQARLRIYFHIDWFQKMNYHWNIALTIVELLAKMKTFGKTQPRGAAGNLYRWVRNS